MSITKKVKKIMKNGIEYLFDFVDLTSNQTIAGVKTFSLSPVVPAPTNNTDAATKKYVDDKYADLMAMGKFLSLWNCATGQPISFPLDTPYTYHTGDYFMVEILATSSNDNLMPNGSSYTGSASQTPDTTNEVKKGDFYIYDGTVRLYASNHGKDVSFSNIAGQPTDNTNLATALGNKQDSLTLPATPTQGNLVTWGADNETLVDGGIVPTGVPSGGTDGQVLSKVSGSVAWANPTGGAEIEYKTQAEYNALLPGALTDNKHYFIYASSGGGGGWQPGADTIAYYEFDGNLNDSSGNNRNLTMGAGSFSYTTLASGQKYCAIDVGAYAQFSSMPFSRSAYTLSTWVFFDVSSADMQTYGKFLIEFPCGNNYRPRIDCYQDKVFGIVSLDNAYVACTRNKRYYIVVTYDNNLASLYIDGNLIGSYSYSNGATSGDLYLNGPYANNQLKGGISELILENKVWSASDINDYYNATKSNYGIS